ncbi:hypothetical protein DPMN_117081 [Dreissena polymorpha]|uniref:Uncharacterized protein n=1 Tax=Dreissena polymorpha TaxID=45954 RepID=A0A9D4KP72_DREPO|nr:hypothetical protein DPMN_117081 [Dreissena polymorpha]
MQALLRRYVDIATIAVQTSAGCRPIYIITFHPKAVLKLSDADQSSTDAHPAPFKGRVCVTHRTATGSSLPDAWRSNTFAGDRIICD